MNLLSESPRHHEWVTLTHGTRELQAVVVYPEKSGPAKSAIVINKNRGLNDGARLFTDKLAAEGFLTTAPDLVSNTNGKKRTADFENADAARDAIYSLDPEQVTLDLDAAFDYIQNDPSATGEVAIVGFTGVVPRLSDMRQIIFKLVLRTFSMEQVPRTNRL